MDNCIQFYEECLHITEYGLCIVFAKINWWILIYPLVFFLMVDFEYLLDICFHGGDDSMFRGLLE